MTEEVDGGDSFTAVCCDCSWKIKITDKTDMMADKIPSKDRTIKDRWLYFCVMIIFKRWWSDFSWKRGKRVSRFLALKHNPPAILESRKVRLHCGVRIKNAFLCTSAIVCLCFVECSAVRSEHVMGFKSPD